VSSWQSSSIHLAYSHYNAHFHYPGLLQTWADVLSRFEVRAGGGKLLEFLCCGLTDAECRYHLTLSQKPETNPRRNRPESPHQ